MPNGSVLYFRTLDITIAVRELEAKGVSFIDKPHLIAPMEDHDLWMTFFKDPAGNTLALMQKHQRAISCPAAKIHRRDAEFTWFDKLTTSGILHSRAS